MKSKVIALAGSDFHKDVVDLFVLISKREEFWLDLEFGHMYPSDKGKDLFWDIPEGWPIEIQMSELYRDLIDFKSTFTATHSAGVSEAASVIARLFGFTEQEEEMMKVAGNLHDLGKLADPNSILEKPGPLTKHEMAIMKCHTYWTYAVLKGVEGFHQVTEWAPFHHERLDGSGYPFH